MMELTMKTKLLAALILVFAAATAAHAGVIVTEAIEAVGVGWPDTPTWQTYSADYLGSTLGVDSSNRYSQTHTVASENAGTVSKFMFRYSNTTAENDSYSFQVYETADPTASTLVVGTKVLDISFTLTQVAATTSDPESHPVFALELTGDDQVTLEAGKAYSFELIGTSTGSMQVIRRGGTAGSGRRLYQNRDMLYPDSGKDSVIAYVVAVPEPGSLALIGAGVGLIAVRRRRR